MKEIFKKHKCCVILIGYNDQAQLRMLLAEVLQYTEDVIILIDSKHHFDTDSSEVNAERVQVIKSAYLTEKGKALQESFAHALQSGYEYAITLDNDVDSCPSNLPLFASALNAAPGAILIGSISDGGECEAIQKATISEKVSDFWYWVKTGVKLQNTQSTYRLYPLKEVAEISYISSHLGLEREIIVKAAWQGTAVKNIDIQQKYKITLPRGKKKWSFGSLGSAGFLNTYLLGLALFYYIPLRLLKRVTKENIRAFISKNFFDQSEPLHSKALAIGFGVFMGLFPVWGFQLLIGIPLAHLLKLNKALFIVAANISLPPLIPVFIYGGYKLGGFFVHNPGDELVFSPDSPLAGVQENLYQYFSGAIVLAVVSALLAGMIAYGCLYVARNRRLAVNKEVK